MNKVINMELFSWLTDASQITNTEIEKAYGYFTEHMKTVSQSENTYPEIFRMLNKTRVELVSIESLNRYVQGEKCPKIRRF